MGVSINTSVLGLSLLAMMISGVYGGVVEPSHLKHCQPQMVDLVFSCLESVKIKGPEVPPTRNCCAMVRQVDLPCVCADARKVAKMVSFEKLARVVAKCERPLPPGAKCGDYTVPPVEV